MEKALELLLILLGAIGGLLFFWLFPLKLISRLVHRFGTSAPCPAALSWLVHNPLRRRYMRPVLDRVGIQPGERVLELGSGPGAFTVDAARHAGPEQRAQPDEPVAVDCAGPQRAPASPRPPEVRAAVRLARRVAAPPRPAGAPPTTHPVNWPESPHRRPATSSSDPLPLPQPDRQRHRTAARVAGTTPATGPQSD